MSTDGATVVDPAWENRAGIIWGHAEISEEVVRKCDSTGVLELSGNQAHHLHDVLSRVRKVKKLLLNHCSLPSLPLDTSNMTELEELNLNENDFSEGLNPAVGRLCALKKLTLYRCRLKSLPDSIGDLKVLEELTLSANDLYEGLNHAVGRLFALRKLNLAFCRLTRLPEWLGDLKVLSILDLSGNSLAQYPSCLLRMTKLEELDISTAEALSFLRAMDGGIKSLPVELAFTRLRILSLNGNPITEPPREIWTQGIYAIKSYMRALIPGGELMRADTLNMIGDTGVGKTSIAQSLVQREPCPTEEANRTRVMQQFKMKIDEFSGQSIYINDFGGHEIYHAVMPIFLPVNGLLILVLKMTDQINEARIKKWLLTAFAKSGEIRIIIAGTHADGIANPAERMAWENKVREVSNNILQGAVDEVTSHVCSLQSRHGDSSVDRKLQRLRETHDTLQKVDVHVVTLSCLVRDDGLDRLRDLTVSLLRAPQLLPASWCRVIRDMPKQRKDGLCLTMAQVRDIAKSHLENEDGGAVITLLRYLAKTSQIIWVEDHPRLQNYVFLPPQDIIDVCKTVLHHDNKIRNVHLFHKEALEEYESGILQESLLRAMLAAHEENINHIEQGDVPVSPTFEVMVDFLLQFNLVSHLQLKADGQRFVIPCKLSRDEPPEFMKYNTAGEACLNRVVARLSFIGSLVPLSFFETSLSSMLTVAGTKFEYSHVDHWKCGCIIIHEGVYFLAKLADERITLTAFSNPGAPSPWTVLQPVLRRLHDDVVGTWHGAPPTCSIQCPWCSRRSSQRAVVDSEVGQIKIDMSKLTAPERRDNPRPTCPKCTKSIPQSLCFPPTSFGPNANDQRKLLQFFECGDAEGVNAQCSDLLRRLNKATPQLVGGLDRYSVAAIVDKLIAARDGYGLITVDQCQEIDAEPTDSGKVRKLLRVVSIRGDEAIETLAKCLKCEGVQRPDLAELILRSPLQ